jgi:urease accessory protein
LSVSGLELIRSVQTGSPPEGQEFIPLVADRATLAKRRWRGVAEDGREFGFDVDRALADGTTFSSAAGRTYKILQAAEPVLEIELGNDPSRASVLGWRIGNLHFPIEVTESVIRSVDDPALRQLLEKEKIRWRPATAVFRAIQSGVHAHDH